MPGWHKATLELQRQGRLQMLGIIEEQHPDRTRLFMQWKQMPWPILVDALDLLGVSVVPMTLLIDEYGTIRYVQPRPADLEAFLKATYSDPHWPGPGRRPPAIPPRPAEGARGWHRYANRLALWGGSDRLEQAIEAYQRVVEANPEEGEAHFRLGVLYRRRYDSEMRQAGDFERAVRQWTRALDLDPNQYIWRRRIQQYGPRLDKPYPFYDWVPRARREIRARGEVPLPLRVEPGGAEFARPSRTFESLATGEQNPDPGGRIHRDTEGLIQVETAVVPSPVEAGHPLRVHVVLRPNPALKAHWNNESEDLKLWVEPPRGWKADRHLLSFPNPPRALSHETRRLEFELRAPAGTAGRVQIPAYALYYVCEDVDGTCLYRRHDIPVEVELRSP